MHNFRFSKGNGALQARYPLRNPWFFVLHRIREMIVQSAQVLPWAELISYDAVIDVPDGTSKIFDEQEHQWAQEKMQTTHTKSQKYLRA